MSGRIKPIKIILRSQGHVDRVTQIVNSIPLEPLMEVNISQHKDKKSAAQIRTVHMWINEVREHYQETEGKFYTAKGLKIYFKELFGAVEVIETPAGIKTELKSFADYEQDEMSKFMDDMNHYCGSELRIFLTIPGLEEPN